MNSAVSNYAGTVERLAAQFVGRHSAEQDDLQQEGLIFVWQSLDKGICPSAEMIENRMRDYIRWLGRKSQIPYEAMLPIEMVGEDRLDIDWRGARRGGGTVQGRPAEFRGLNGIPSLADGT